MVQTYNLKSTLTAKFIVRLRTNRNWWQTYVLVLTRYAITNVKEFFIITSRENLVYTFPIYKNINQSQHSIRYPADFIDNDFNFSLFIARGGGGGVQDFGCITVKSNRRLGSILIIHPYFQSIFKVPTSIILC